MFALHKIIISNFRSYKGTHEFEFPVASGLYFLTGINLVDDLGANGSGKTTFIDAITWCLYGQTTRGLKANDVLHDWELAGCQVELELTVGDRRATIKRTQKPNNLTLDDTIVDQKSLETFIRLNYKSFLCSIINSQFGTSFFSLSSSAKLTLFSEINNLDYWLDCSKAAAKQSEQLDAEISTLQSKQDRERGELKQVKNDIGQLTTDEASFEATRYKRCKELRDQLKGFTKQLTMLEEQYKGSNHELAIVRRERTGILEQIKVCEKQRNLFLEKSIKASHQKASMESEIKTKEEKLAKLIQLRGKGICPTCNLEVGEDHLNNEMLSIKNNIYCDKMDLKVHEENAKFFTRQIFKQKNQIDELVSNANELQSEMDLINTELRDLESQMAIIESREKDIHKQLASLDSETNPYTKMLDEKHHNLCKLQSSISEHKATIHNLEAENEAVKFWVKGFKRIRLYAIEQAFQALELEVNNCLSQLGMTEWQITFAIERENKSGGVTKGFMVFVKSPHNKQPVRWENWSGGETQRLELAGDLGLANLIMQQAGLQSAIEMFDEPSTHLSKKGMLDLANMLYERAINEGKTIWIVDHADISNFGEFEGVIVVRKDTNGSSIKMDRN